jgi:hypothetical protein
MAAYRDTICELGINYVLKDWFFEHADAGGRANQRLGGVYTGDSEQAKQAMKILLMEIITERTVLFKDRQRFIRFKGGRRTVISR